MASLPQDRRALVERTLTISAPVDDDMQAFAEEFAIPMELAQEAWNVPGATYAQACRFIFALATAQQIAESEGRESASQYIHAAIEAGLL